MIQQAERAADPRAEDVLRLCVETLDVRSLREQEKRALIEAASSWLGRDDLRELVDQALAPSALRRSRSAEVRAMEAWFGPGGAGQDSGEPQIDLDELADTYGPLHALRMLDVITAVASAVDGIDPREVRRLEWAGQRLGIDPVVVAAVLRRRDPRYSAGIDFRLNGDRVVIGSSVTCDVVLPDPQVLPRHAEIVKGPQGWRVVDVARSRPVLVDDQPVLSAPLEQGSRLRVGPYELRLDGDMLVATNRRGFSALQVRDLDRKIGATVVLDGVTVSLVAGEVIAIVGPSGGGKTTLVTAIQGTAPADSGEVYLDGRDLHQVLQVEPTISGSVPQDDLVLAELTVEETLRAAARLRFGTDEKALENAVESVLRELDIQRIRKSRVGDALRRGISGGQRKRVSLGQELLGRSTRLLFLDEPTSGLDPQAAQDIVQLVRRLADNGRIVVLVTHDLTPEVVAQIDHLLVLARGGRVAWFGPPAEACAWFGVATPDALFYRLADRSPEEWKTAYRESEAARRYIQTRERALDLGFLGSKDDEPAAPMSSARRQYRTLVARYARTKLRDTTGLLVLAAQPPVLAGGMAIVYPGVAAGTIFMLTLSCLWFGLFAGVRELISDRIVWRRERRLGVGVLPYVGSKVLVLGVITAIQSLAMVGLSWATINYADNGFSFPMLLGVCTLTSWVGLGLGLLVSACWTSSEAAVGTLPILLVPQILFSTILVSLRHMDPVSQLLTWITVQRYALDAGLKCGKTFEQASNISSEWERRDISGALYQLGLKPLDPNDMGLPLGFLVLMLGAWAIVFLTTATGVVWSRKD